MTTPAFLKLTRPHGDPIWVNVALIISFTREDRCRTQIETGFDRYMSVLETPDDICELLKVEAPTKWPAPRLNDDDDDDLVRSIVPAVDD
jgi:hypothetical protein